MAEESYEVVLNVYDLSQGAARQMSVALLGTPIEGIWHTQVQVFGQEYFFSGGIVSSPIGQTVYGKPVRVVPLGTTHVPKDVFEDFLNEIRHRYTAESYSILTHNCNNFSEEIAQFLVGKSIPEYILRLPQDVMTSPMGSLLLPMIQQIETTLRNGAVPQLPRRLDKEVAAATTATAATARVMEAAENEDAALNDARVRVQEEIRVEFAALMASGGLRASEAAALAARKVMQKHGISAGGSSKS